jgi:hypothetical protein
MPEDEPKREQLIDQTLADSFPASDPPSFIGAGAVRALLRLNESGPVIGARTLATRPMLPSDTEMPGKIIRFSSEVVDALKSMGADRDASFD